MAAVRLEARQYFGKSAIVASTAPVAQVAWRGQVVHVDKETEVFAKFLQRSKQREIHTYPARQV